MSDKALDRVPFTAYNDVLEKGYVSSCPVMSLIMFRTRTLQNICRIYNTVKIQNFSLPYVNTVVLLCTCSHPINKSRKVSRPETLMRETDKIGPPDRISNLRPVIFVKLKTESELEKLYRKAREETQDWNQDFWSRHNTNFIQERKRFQEALKAKGKTSLTSDDMSIFYKAFLDKNWQAHFDYNIGWYKRNMRLLYLDVKCRMSKLKFKRTLTIKP